MAEKNLMNLPTGWLVDVFDATTAEPLLLNAEVHDVDALLLKRSEPVTVEFVGVNVVSRRGSAPLEGES